MKMYKKNIYIQSVVHRRGKKTGNVQIEEVLMRDFAVQVAELMNLVVKFGYIWHFMTVIRNINRESKDKSTRTRA